MRQNIICCIVCRANALFSELSVRLYYGKLALLNRLYRPPKISELFMKLPSPMKIFFSAFVLFIFMKAYTQQHDFSNKYVVPGDTLVQQKLAHWQDIKFGLLMHWGTYSEWGIVESWSICPEDEGWAQRKGTYAGNYFDYGKAYENLQTTFNPTKFDPSKWAGSGKRCGNEICCFHYKTPRWLLHV